MVRFVIYTVIAVLLSTLVTFLISLINPEAGGILSVPISLILGLIAGWKAVLDD
ncbi:hypothetical protein DXY21_03839 [Bacillus velezensis]|uniref:hypothetical protein n=1 Tax=Bacillus velezensis TaxID=492670 RepID=UPI000ABDFAED|nr:hypothetical protein [Bacillus velezensis]QHM89764.1 hypothetical protein DXY21_03839 [Bacillus velezensis]